MKEIGSTWKALNVNDKETYGGEHSKHKCEFVHRCHPKHLWNIVKSLSVDQKKVVD